MVRELREGDPLRLTLLRSPDRSLPIQCSRFMTLAADVQSPGAQTFKNRLISPRLLQAYMAAKMPLGALAGLKVEVLDGYKCSVSVPYSWRTKNPFGSIYFAALSMAGELSCAGLALMA